MQASLLMLRLCHEEMKGNLPEAPRGVPEKAGAEGGAFSSHHHASLCCRVSSALGARPYSLLVCT